MHPVSAYCDRNVYPRVQEHPHSHSGLVYGGENLPGELRKLSWGKILLPKLHKFNPLKRQQPNLFQKVSPSHLPARIGRPRGIFL